MWSDTDRRIRLPDKNLLEPYSIRIKIQISHFTITPQSTATLSPKTKKNLSWIHLTKSFWFCYIPEYDVSNIYNTGRPANFFEHPANSTDRRQFQPSNNPAMYGVPMNRKCQLDVSFSRGWPLFRLVIMTITASCLYDRFSENLVHNRLESILHLDKNTVGMQQVSWLRVRLTS